MSDGREEREERERRLAQEKDKDRSNDLDQHPVDQWKPERKES
jgi:hypothetical protein